MLWSLLIKSLFSHFYLLPRCSVCVSNESGFISSGANYWKLFSLRLVKAASLLQLFPKASHLWHPSHLLCLMGGFLTSQGWPFNFTLTSDLVVAHVWSALTTCRFDVPSSLLCIPPSHHRPAPFLLTLLCQSHTRVIGPIFRARTTFTGERWKCWQKVF